jgi:hypothetical protein
LGGVSRSNKKPRRLSDHFTMRGNEIEMKKRSWQRELVDIEKGHHYDGRLFMLLSGHLKMKVCLGRRKYLLQLSKGNFSYLSAF